MNRDDIIRMAREAGFEFNSLGGTHTSGKLDEHLERFAALVAAAEREACARVCEAQQNAVVKDHPARIEFDPNNFMAKKCAAAIRARGNT
jgi:hypothetical protein